MKVDPLLKRHRSYASSNEVWKYIAELGISKASISFYDALRDLVPFVQIEEREKTHGGV